MIPPAFKPKGSNFNIALEGLVPEYSDRGDQGESIVYHFLKQLGEQKHMGMFVVNGFQLNDIINWNRSCDKKRMKNYQVPQVLTTARTSGMAEPEDGECDFIIFHHTFGIILLEVKNDLVIRANNLYKGQDQLTRSHDLMANFAAHTQKGTEKLTLPYRKVIALPSTSKVSFYRSTDFPNLKDDIAILFAEDLVDVGTFEQWWVDKVERSASGKISNFNQKAYEQALSCTLAVRHLGPMTEHDYIADLSKSLASYKHLEKGVLPELSESEFPHFHRWWLNTLQKIDEAFDFGVMETAKRVEETFIKENKLKNEQNLLSRKGGVRFIDTLLSGSQQYLLGDEPSVLDALLAGYFDKKYILGLRNIVKLMNNMRQLRREFKPIESHRLSLKSSELPFIELTSVQDLNKLERHLSQSPFLEGDKPTELDRYVLEKLTCNLRFKYSQLPIIFTSDQLAVFEGPTKQLIIGGPGTGKTELMKFKAQQLAVKMKACKMDLNILYIVASGSPLLYHQLKDFFKKFPLIEVLALKFEQESPLELERAKEVLRERMASGKYGHAFIDEAWIGSKPAEHEVILELITKEGSSSTRKHGNIPGYVWISSVFDMNRELIDKEEKTKSRIDPLLAAIKKEGGVVSHLTQVARATNNIIKLERDYSSRYQNRTFTYGTEKMLGHSLEGPAIAWEVVQDVASMYKRCVEIVQSATRDAMHEDDTTPLRKKSLILNPADILIVNFAVRASESLLVRQSLKELLVETIPVWTFGDDIEQFMNCKEGKLTLLDSPTRDDSTYLDGVEWPMVMVILPSAVLLNKAKPPEGAEGLRNYDTYIAFFRAQAKLVIISDKWRSQEEFLKDVDQKNK